LVIRPALLDEERLLNQARRLENDERTSEERLPDGRRWCLHIRISPESAYAELREKAPAGGLGQSDLEFKSRDDLDFSCIPAQRSSDCRFTYSSLIIFCQTTGITFRPFVMGQQEFSRPLCKELQGTSS
jgi:hypothetical protein